jgi:Integrase core domain
MDDFTRMTLVYFLKEKSQALDTFKKFKALVENQSNFKIKVLRSDKGEKYTSNQFVKFFEDHGIKK